MIMKFFYYLWNNLYDVPKDQRCHSCQRTGLQGGNLEDVIIPMPRLLKEAGFSDLLCLPITEKLCGKCRKKGY